MKSVHSSIKKAFIQKLFIPIMSLIAALGILTLMYRSFKINPNTPFSTTVEYSSMFFFIIFVPAIFWCKIKKKCKWLKENHYDLNEENEQEF